MALSSVADIAQALVDEMESLSADFDGLSTAQKNGIRDGLFTAIATVIRDELTTNAEVSFGAGDFAGTDDAGDAPTSITASGGSIS